MRIERTRLLLTILLIIMLFGCASAPTTKAVLEFSNADNSLGIVNVFSQEVVYSRFSKPAFRSKVRLVLDPDFDVEKVVSDKAYKMLSSLGANDTLVVATTEEQKSKWRFANNESLNVYVNRISKDNELFDLPELSNLSKLVLFVPAFDNPPAGVVRILGTGLRYYEDTGVIEPHASSRIFVFDIPTQSLLGSHYLTTAHSEIQLLNTLSREDIVTIEKQYKEELADRSGSAFDNGAGLTRKLRAACAAYERIDSYSKENRAIAHEGILRAIDRMFAKLNHIYTGTAVPKYASWRTSFALSHPNSCETVL